MPAVSPIAPASELHPSAPQHLRALAYANRVRLARAALKRSVGAGEASAAEVIRDCPWEAESMTLLELLTSQRRWGRTRARKLLAAAGLYENKRLGTLTDRQRAMLASTLELGTGLRRDEFEAAFAAQKRNELPPERFLKTRRRAEATAARTATPAPSRTTGARLETATDSAATVATPAAPASSSVWER